MLTGAPNRVLQGWCISARLTQKFASPLLPPQKADDFLELDFGILQEKDANICQLALNSRERLLMLMSVWQVLDKFNSDLIMSELIEFMTNFMTNSWNILPNNTHVNLMLGLDEKSVGLSNSRWDVSVWIKMVDRPTFPSREPSNRWELLLYYSCGALYENTQMMWGQNVIVWAGRTVLCTTANKKESNGPLSHMDSWSGTVLTWDYSPHLSQPHRCLFLWYPMVCTHDLIGAAFGTLHRQIKYSTVCAVRAH